MTSASEPQLSPQTTGPALERTPTVNPAIPGPPAKLLIGWRGNLLSYFRRPLRTMEDLRGRYGDVVCLARGGNEPLVFQPLGHKSSTLFAFGAENNRQVLTQSNLFESDKVRAPKQAAWLGDNMVAVNRRERAQQRRTLVPAFTAEHLRAYYTDIVALTQAMLDRWRIGTTIDITHELDNLTAEIASKTFYDQDLRNEPGTVAALAREIAEALFSPVAKIPINLPGTPYRRFLGLTRQAEETVRSEIEKRRRHGSDGDDVLSMMIRAIDEGNIEMSDHHLVGNAFTLYLAGHDVPANALSWTLYLLSQHPKVCGDLVDELTGSLGGDPPAYEQIWKLPLLDRVIKESLRVLSPAIIIWRRPTETAELGGFEIPAGSEVLISPYITHVDPAIYSEPRRFLPERWNELKPSPFEYLPFSYGARKCLGAAFAEMMLRLIVSMVVQRYRLELVPKTRVDLTVTMTMKPKKGLPMVVRAQDGEHPRSRAEITGELARLVDLGRS